MSDTNPASAQPETSVPKVGVAQLAGLLLMGLAFGGLTGHWLALLVFLTAVAVMYDARDAGIRRDPGKKGLLNMDPFSWAVANVLLFVVCWPLYLYARTRPGVQRGRPVLLALVCLGGGATVLGMGASIAIAAFQAKPLQASVQCKGGASGIGCEIRQVAGNVPGTVCWTITVDCASGTPARASSCVDTEPGKLAQHVVPYAEVEGAATCGKATKMTVTVNTVKPRS